MKRLSQKDIENLSFKESYRDRKSRVEHIYNEINTLGLNDTLFIEKEEWVLKNQPSIYAFPSRIRTGGRNYKVRALANDSGFVVTRTA